ncbi:unnamed protein product [Rodentolepis nana]|uniref:Uncharacterized protein n=1 Tax=Rodentolepis nana TaxID=102285 RepID=A0A0R3TGI5_RODNA|nr:unnamed protein product [Rodentolepis nana]
MRFNSDSLDPKARFRSNSLKVGRRELEMLQLNVPSLFPRQHLKRSVALRAVVSLGDPAISSTASGVELV